MTNKKYFSTLFFAIFILLNISCSNKKDSPSIMINRYDAFLEIMPKEIAEKFSVDSKEYSNLYKDWQIEGRTWIEETIVKEDQGAAIVTNTYNPDVKEYNIGILTNKFYERENPQRLMNEVYKHTQMLSKEIKALEENEEFKNKLYKIKQDEAIVNFTTEQTVFYFLWNYLIMLDRPRRFQ